jgi:hypothetical protein
MLTRLAKQHNFLPRTTPRTVNNLRRMMGYRRTALEYNAVNSPPVVKYAIVAMVIFPFLLAWLPRQLGKVQPTGY